MISVENVDYTSRLMILQTAHIERHTVQAMIMSDVIDYGSILKYCRQAVTTQEVTK